MITFTASSFVSWHSDKSADRPCDCGLGNMLFFIAGTIGIATKNGYDYGFFPWKDQKFFKNLLPSNNIEYPQHNIDWGFHGFDVPDNVSIYGYMQSFKYIEHCDDLIRHYFEFKEQYARPIKNCIFMHYRAYDAPFMHKLQGDYYHKALQFFPKMRTIVITDNVERAKKTIGLGFEYWSGSPIEDFYLLSNAENIIGSNSTFSAWGAYLSRAKSVFPLKWMAEGESQTADDIYMKDWILI